MLSTFTRAQLAQAGPNDISDELERGRIVVFPECPIDLPPPADLSFLREEMPKVLNLKNISYHPEVDRIIGIKGQREVVERTRGILKGHSQRAQAFLGKAIPLLSKQWMIGTSSFRPMQEKGRNLSAHASNELVHVDAGAYGATHGDRIIRFFVNVNPVEDRVWITKGAFPELYRRYGERAGVGRRNGNESYLREGLLDRMRTAAIGALSTVVPPAKLLDSSPYDRAMRRFHNFMKDTPEFQSTPEGHEEFQFKPLTAWMVFTDMVSHACISGQHAFVDTFVVPLGNCRLPEMAPINILKGHP
ncbi:MAG TPA: Kdo hydroxylase family protein [Planctomycetota bacterium]|nr:Kdo hydroxylase family protein [Planctomycetota bacterium]